MFQFVPKARRTANHPEDTPLATATETETNLKRMNFGKAGGPTELTSDMERGRDS